MKKKLLLVMCLAMAMILTACAGRKESKEDPKPSQEASKQAGSEQEKETQKTLDRVMKYVASDGKILEIRYVTAGGDLESIKQFDSEGNLEVNYGSTVEDENGSATYIVGRDEQNQPIEQGINYTYSIGGDMYQGGGGPKATYLIINDASAVLTLVFDKKDGSFNYYEIYAKEYFLQN